MSAHHICFAPKVHLLALHECTSLIYFTPIVHISDLLYPLYGAHESFSGSMHAHYTFIHFL